MNNDWLELEGKTVIVTGAASGIGKAVAQEFLNIGANVVISDMAENAPEMDAKEGQLLYVRTDVTKVSDVEAMVAKTIETFGTIDVLVNNAGINIPRLLVDPKDPKGQYELDEAAWDKVCNVNLKGVFFCAQARDGFIRRLAQLRHHPRRKQRVAEHLGAEQLRIEHLANGARNAAALLGDQPGRKRHAPAENPLFFVRPQKHPHGDIVCNVTDQRACGGTNQPAPVKASHVSESPPSASYLTYFDYCIAFHLFCQARQDSAHGGRKL